MDSDKPFAGLTNFKGDDPTQAEVLIAKNYLEEKELKVLNNLVAAYFDLAELVKSVCLGYGTEFFLFIKNEYRKIQSQPTENQ